MFLFKSPERLKKELASMSTFTVCVTVRNLGWLVCWSSLMAQEPVLAKERQTQGVRNLPSRQWALLKEKVGCLFFHNVWINKQWCKLSSTVFLIFLTLNLKNWRLKGKNHGFESSNLPEVWQILLGLADDLVCAIKFSLKKTNKKQRGSDVTDH